MNLGTSVVRYEFIEGYETTNPASIRALERELESDILAQAEDGFLLTGGATDGDAIAWEYRFSAEAQTAFEDPDIPFNLEIFSTDDFAEFEAEIREQDTVDNDIVNLSFSVDTNGENLWNAYFGPSTGPSFYTFSEDAEEFTELLDASFEEDRTLLDIEYGDGTWIATFDESDTRFATSANDNFDDLTGQIATRARNDLDLVDLEYGDGAWFARFGDNPGDSTYATSKDFEDFQEEIEAQEEDGFDLVDVEYVKDTWYGVFQESEAATDSRSAFVANENFELAALETSAII